MSLTIVIPSIGRESVQEAIDSVNNQTVKTEFLVEFDTSHEGPSVLRNRMIQACKTTWVGFCDDDDWLDPHYHEWLKEIKDADMVIFQMERPEGIVLPGHTDVDKLVYNWVGVSFALRTRIAKQHPFKSMLAEDFDLIQRLREYRLVVSPRVAYFVG